tara:strand:+ start:4932 stop:6185 length:1254 start_codon:yes stop_codon:yes gene_type:complete
MRKILVSGPVLSQSGYGEQSRFALRALRSRPDLYDIYINPLSWGQTTWITEDSEERRWIDSCIKKFVGSQHSGSDFDVSLQITIPNEWQKLAPVNIGYTAGIETNRIAPVWIEKGNIMERIIVVSNHSKNVYQDTAYGVKNEQTGQIEDFRTKTPIDVVGYPVRKIEPVDIDLNLEYDFNFLAVAQWGPRKNLAKTIKWFIEEFKNEEVGLVLKINVANNSIMDKDRCLKKLKENLRSYDDRKCKIYMLHGDMPTQEMASLYYHPKIKALINIAHGEGYGLPMFEAAYSGLPIITIGWSGQVDFLYAPAYDKKKKRNVIKPHFASVQYDLKQVGSEAVWEGVLEKGSMWAYAHKGSYKNKIRDVHKNHGKYKKLARQLKEHTEFNFSEEKIYEKFVSSVESCFEHNSIEEDVQVMVI